MVFNWFRGLSSSSIRFSAGFMVFQSILFIFWPVRCFLGLKTNLLMCLKSLLYFITVISSKLDLYNIYTPV
jgi:hypothetical protein